MNKEITKLVEKVARRIVVYTCKGCEWEHKDAPHCSGETSPHELCEYQFSEAKQILFGNNLALIAKPQHFDWEDKVDFERSKYAMLAYVYPLEEEGK